MRAVLKTERPRQLSNVGEIFEALVLRDEVLALLDFFYFDYWVAWSADAYFSMFIFVNLIPNSALNSFNDYSYCYCKSIAPLFDSTIDGCCWASKL